MRKPSVVLTADGDFEFRDWPVRIANLLWELPALTSPDVPEGPARDRLYPAPGTDPGQADEWRRHVHPDLHALFADATQIVSDDLGVADRGPRGRLHRLKIPQGHVAAWISALNTARLRLAAEHGIDADAMRGPLEELGRTRGEAMIRIDFFGTLQAHLISGVSFSGGPPAEGRGQSGDVA